jgi:hypothetical protein
MKNGLSAWLKDHDMVDWLLLAAIVFLLTGTIVGAFAFAYGIHGEL